MANNIVGRSFGGLLRPLAGQQGAPIGWLWLERAAVLVLGDNEYALRLVPLVAGVAALLLAHRITRRLLGPWPAAAAVALLALSPAAVRYSVEVKQYSSDMAIAAALTLLALDRRRPWRWAAAGAVAVWCSHPAVLVLAAGAVATVPESIGPSLLWLASFGLDWLVSLRRLGHNSYLHHYWAAGFRPAAALRLVSDPGGLPARWLATGVVGLGLLWLVRRRGRAGAVVAMPAVAGIGAAAVGAYPLAGRMALWLLPVIVVGIVAAVVAVVTPAPGAHARPARPGPAGLALVVVVALLVQSPVRAVAATAHDPATRIDMRPLLQTMAPLVRPGDHVWVHSNDAAAAAVYARSTGVRADGEVWDGVCPRPELVGTGRIWFVYGYRGSAEPADEAALIDAAFRGRLLLTIHRPGVTAWLWSTGGVPAPASAPAALGCLAVTRPQPTS